MKPLLLLLLLIPIYVKTQSLTFSPGVNYSFLHTNFKTFKSDFKNGNVGGQFYIALDDLQLDTSLVFLSNPRFVIAYDHYGSQFDYNPSPYGRQYGSFQKNTIAFCIYPLNFVFSKNFRIRLGGFINYSFYHQITGNYEDKNTSSNEFNSNHINNFNTGVASSFAYRWYFHQLFLELEYAINVGFIDPISTFNALTIKNQLHIGCGLKLK